VYALQLPCAAFAFASASEGAAAAASLPLPAHSPGPDSASPATDSPAAVVLQVRDSSYTADTPGTVALSFGAVAAVAGPAQPACTALVRSCTAAPCSGVVQLVQVGVGVGWDWVWASLWPGFGAWESLWLGSGASGCFEL